MCKEILVIDLLNLVAKNCSVEEFLVKTGLEIGTDAILYIGSLVEFVEEFSNNSKLVGKLESLAMEVHRKLKAIA